MLDYKIMYVSHTGNTQRLAVCIYQSLQQLGKGDSEEINCNTILEKAKEMLEC